MDLKVYYKRVREIEQTISDPFVLIVSEATDDGGKDGVRSEVSRNLAARMIMDRRARLASNDEIKEYYDGLAQAKKAADQQAAVNRMRVTVVPVNPAE
jgi:hypothetical protein